MQLHQSYSGSGSTLGQLDAVSMWSITVSIIDRLKSLIHSNVITYLLNIMGKLFFPQDDKPD